MGDLGLVQCSSVVWIPGSGHGPGGGAECWNRTDKEDPVSILRCRFRKAVESKGRHRRRVLCDSVSGLLWQLLSVNVENGHMELARWESSVMPLQRRLSWRLSRVLFFFFHSALHSITVYQQHSQESSLCFILPHFSPQGAASKNYQTQTFLWKSSDSSITSTRNNCTLTYMTWLFTFIPTFIYSKLLYLLL